MKSFKQFSKDIDEGWKDYLPSIKNINSAALSFADTATLGGYKYARAGVDYAAKNAMNLAGVGSSTTYKKELEQEKEKLSQSGKESPRAAAAGNLAGYGAIAMAPEIPLIGAAATKALKAAEIGSKTSQVVKGLRTIIGK